MAQSIEENLLEVIKRDDIKGFDALMERVQCGGFRLGRFPVLSVLYLYKSRKIISAYEEKFIKITAWEALREPAGVSAKFSKKAGKCLRLYLNEVVSPLEMLLILDRTGKLKRVYPLTKASSAVKGRLQSIYSIKYSLGVKFEGNDIILDRRPLKRSEKKRIATVCLCSLLAVAVAVGTPVTAVALIPKRVEGEVTKLSQIDFSKKTAYTLKKDITIPENFAVEKTNCTIVGNGKKLIFERGASLGEFSGKLSGAEIQTSGSPIFTELTEKAVISSVTVNVTADITTLESTALIAVDNYGEISGVTVNVSGSALALVGDSDVTLGGIVVNNFYRRTASSPEVKGIRNCKVNYSNFSLEGRVSANAIFSGVAGVNYGYLVNCTVTGQVSSDTVDLAGICAENGGLLSNDINEANLTQITESDSWNPIVGGIAYRNTNTIQYCENRGALTAKSVGRAAQPLTVSVAGMACINSSDIIYCKNSGSITAEGDQDVYAGGICAVSYDKTNYCVAEGDITVTAGDAYVGGIFGASQIAQNYYVYYGCADYCISRSDITVSSLNTSRVGGIGGFILEGRYVDENKQILGYFSGSVTNSFFTGSISSGGYFGAIVGVCGENIYYEKNLYYDSRNFENDYHANSSLPSFGATNVMDDSLNETFTPIEGDGSLVKTEQEIEQMDAYKKILSELSK